MLDVLRGAPVSQVAQTRRGRQERSGASLQHTGRELDAHALALPEDEDVVGPHPPADGHGVVTPGALHDEPQALVAVAKVDARTEISVAQAGRPRGEAERLGAVDGIDAL